MPQGQQPHYQDFILLRELAEVYLLLDNLSGSATKDLENGDDAPRVTDDAGAAKDWIEAVCEIGWPPTGSPEAQAKDIATLIRVRDYLNRRAAPANGATIAFTLLVGGEGRAVEVGEAPSARSPAGPAAPALPSPPAPTAEPTAAEGDAPAAANEAASASGPRGWRGREPPSRIELATLAFPNLQTDARKFRGWMIGTAACLIAALGLTCFLSWETAKGNGLLGQLSTAEADLAATQLKIDDAAGGSGAAAAGQGNATGQGGDRGGATNPGAAPNGAAGANAAGDQASPRPMVQRYCDKPRAIVAATKAQLAATKTPQAAAMSQSLYEWFDSAAQARLCDDRDQKTVALDAAAGNLRNWLTQPWLLIGPAAAPTLASDCPQPDYCARLKADGQRAADRQLASSVLGVLSGAMLPFLYGLLGAGAAVVRNLSFKLQQWQLAPRDQQISLIQVALGAVLGACIGLFVSPAGAAGVAADTSSGAASSQGLLGPVHLSAAALCFIAGFFVEGVFRALEALMRRVFNLADPGQPPPR